MLKRSDVAQAMWGVITSAYGATATTKVAVPADEVTEIVLSVLANVLAGVPAKDRQRLQREIGPKLDRMIGAVRNRPNIILPSRPRDGLLVPN